MNVHNAADYDALTDLFMSDHPLPASQRKDAKHEVNREVRPEAAMEIDVPALPKLKLAPQAAAPAVSSGAAHVRSIGAAHVPSTRKATIEGLILGHLPVLGAAWVTQYAKFAAEQRAANIALLRSHEGQTWLDIVQPKHAQPISTSGEDNDEPSLLASTAKAASLAQGWIVRVDDCNEPDLLTLPSLSCITLLTGADDPAILASYRTIKHLAQLAESLGRPLSTNDEQDGLRVQLVIMGADAARAAEADAKIRRSAQAFLGASIAPAIAIAKISPCSTVALYRGASTASLSELLDIASSKNVPSEMVASERSNVQHEAPAPVPSHQPPSASIFSPQAPMKLSLVPAAPKLAQIVEAKPAEETVAIPVPQASTSASRVQARATAPATNVMLPDLPPMPAARSNAQPAFASQLVASAPAPQVAALVRSDEPAKGGRPPATAPISTLALVAQSDVPSLRPVKAACPYAKGVELGIDATGMLHAAAMVSMPAAISRGNLQNDASETHATEASAMAALHTARQWASEHHALLQSFVQTANAAHSLQTGPCVLHVLTPNNGAIRTLMHAPVRVHLLVQAGTLVASRVL
jgi:hypothetical protein